MKAREKREQEIAFDKDDDLITRMMKVLEYRGYVDTDWRSENTFEEDVRPLFEKMIKQSLQDTTEEREIEIKEVGENQMTFTNVFDCPKCGGHIYGGSTVNYCGECGAKIKRIR